MKVYIPLAFRVLMLSHYEACGQTNQILYYCCQYSFNLTDSRPPKGSHGPLNSLDCTLRNSGPVNCGKLFLLYTL